MLKESDAWEVSEFVFDLMGECGYEVVTPGERELMEGHEAIKGLLSRQPQIQVVSANITDKSGNLCWDEYTIVEKAGITLAVTGVTGGSSYAFNLTRGTQKADDFDFKDSRDVLRELVPRLREKADAVVVLLHETPSDARRIVEEIPAMDVVIVGHSPGYMFNPDRIDNTLLVRGGNRGQYLSVLDLAFDSSQTIVDYSGEGKPLGSTVEKIREMDIKINEYEKERKARQQSERRKEAVGKAMSQGTESFIGAVMCQRCHSQEYTGWVDTAHFSAQISGDPPGPASDGVDVTGVQCEHCHGLGTFHGTPGMVTKVSEQTCRSCHESEGVSDIDYARAIAEGIHH